MQDERLLEIEQRSFLFDRRYYKEMYTHFSANIRYFKEQTDSVMREDSELAIIAFGFLSIFLGSWAMAISRWMLGINSMSIPTFITIVILIITPILYIAILIFTNPSLNLLHKLRLVFIMPFELAKTQVEVRNDENASRNDRESATLKLVLFVVLTFFTAGAFFNSIIPYLYVTSHKELPTHQIVVDSTKEMTTEINGTIYKATKEIQETKIVKYNPTEDPGIEVAGIYINPFSYILLTTVLLVLGCILTFLYIFVKAIRLHREQRLMAERRNDDNN